jgi:F-type H+-transporting ATPase subunit b
MRNLRALLFSAVIGLASMLTAQDQGNPSPQGHPAATEPAGPGTQPAADPNPATHVTTEHAAAPTHGGAKTQHGPEVKLPFMHRGLTATEQFLLKTVNFIVFALVLIIPLKSVLAAAFKARAQELEERLTLAEREKAEGEAQVRELEARMAGLEGELDGILSKADADAVGEKERILEAARTEAEVILAQAMAEIDFQRRNVEQELRALVAQLAVEGATQRLQARLEGPAAATLVDRAIHSISQRASDGGVQ